MLKQVRNLAAAAAGEDEIKAKMSPCRGRVVACDFLFRAYTDSSCEGLGCIVCLLRSMGSGMEALTRSNNDDTGSTERNRNF